MNVRAMQRTRSTHQLTRVNAYSDGSCDNSKTRANARKGGIGVIMSITDGVSLEWKRYSEGQYLETTSARMEIRGLLRILEESPIPCNLTAYIDNQYVCYTISKGWLFNWISQGILDEKQNSDLWKEVLSIYDKHKVAGSVITINWIKGHDGNILNETVDLLANEGRKNGELRIICREQYAKERISNCNT